MKRITACLGIAGAFVLLSLPLLWVGNPESPAYARLRALGASPDIAVIGDSRAHVGISPRKILETLSRSGLGKTTAHNFAVDGTDTVHHYSFAVNGLLKWGAPKIILWTANPLQFDASRPSNRLEQLAGADIVPLWRAGAPAELLLDLVTMRFFPQWKHRPLIATAVSDYSERAGKRTLPFQTKILGLRFEPETLSREYVTFDDGQVPFKVLAWKNRFERGARGYTTDYTRLRLSDWHFNIARALARAARESGARLIIVETPVAPRMRAMLHENAAGGAKHLEWRRRIADIAREEQALFWNHSELYGEDESFGDPGHMTMATAENYSSMLGRLLVEAAAIETAGL